MALKPSHASTSASLTVPYASRALNRSNSDRRDSDYALPQPVNSPPPFGYPTHSQYLSTPSLPRTPGRPESESVQETPTRNLYGFTNNGKGVGHNNNHSYADKSHKTPSPFHHEQRGKKTPTRETPDDRRYVNIGSGSLEKRKSRPADHRRKGNKYDSTVT